MKETRLKLTRPVKSSMENEKEKDLMIEIRLHRQLIGPSGENS